MATPSEQIEEARLTNLPILSVLANRPGNDFFSFIVPIIGFMAIMTSFFGFFLGTLEVLNGVLSQGLRECHPDHTICIRRIHKLSLFIVGVSCWVAGVGNWSVIVILDALVAPMMAIILFFLPVIALYKVKSLK